MQMQLPTEHGVQVLTCSSARAPPSGRAALTERAVGSLIFSPRAARVFRPIIAFVAKDPHLHLRSLKTKDCSGRATGPIPITHRRKIKPCFAKTSEEKLLQGNGETIYNLCMDKKRGKKCSIVDIFTLDISLTSPRLAARNGEIREK